MRRVGDRVAGFVEPAIGRGGGVLGSIADRVARVLRGVRVIGFSRYPLQVISIVGFLFSGVAFLVAIAYIALKIAGTAFPVGNPTIVLAVAFFSGIQLLSLGVIGEYVGRIYDEARDRPKWILESRHGFDGD